LSKWTNAANAAEQVFDGATLALAGSGGGLLEADAILAALEQRFLATGHPRDLTIVHALGIGDGKGSGLGRFAHAGMVKRVIGGHWSWSPAMQRMAQNDEIEAYSFPAGVISTLLREIGAGRPGLVTHVGLRTFADPRLDGGRINRRATDALVELIELDGREYLRYKPFKVDFALVRGSTADARGNVTLRHEPADLDVYAAALAAHNSGGRVIVQVKEASTDYVPARLVRIPGILVDALVKTPSQVQCAISDYDPALSGETRAGFGEGFYEAPEGIRRIIAARAARELQAGQSANFGFGIPGGIPGILAEEARLGTFWGSVEQGIHNGAMLDGAMFGTARNADAIVSSVDQFDFYSGGGVDVTFLGMGEMDGEGNINVSKLGATVVGPGGFIDITQGARKIVFCGSFEAKGLEVEASEDGGVRIVSPGSVPKLVERVQHVTFSGAQARIAQQEVLYVTERAVFRLEEHGVRLVEVAPGIDIGRDVLARMRFTPLVDERLLVRADQDQDQDQETLA
jgi:acyl CoA:acetate/3-ketoacid CoA transferase